MMALPHTELLGNEKCTPSVCTKRVKKRPISWTVPSPLPTTETNSPARKGRNTNNITPAAIFCKVFCKAKPTAKPAAPNTAIILAVCTPKRAKTATITKILMVHTTTDCTMGTMVVEWTSRIFVIVAVLARFGVQTASIIAVVGAAGLAVGLALQNTLQNIASGVMLLVLRQIGRASCREIE